MCPERSDCIDQCDGFRCDCKDGFTKTAENECCDENQCKNTGKYGVGGPCGENATCINKCVEFECVCNEGRVTS